MSAYLEFVVRGQAEPGGSKRALPAGGRPGARPIVVDANPNLKRWQDVVAWEARQAIGEAPLFEGPLLLRLRFYRSRPIAHYTSKGTLSATGRRHPYPATRPDLTKLIRAVEDALTGVVWRDDQQVVQQDAMKLYGDPPRVELEIGPALPSWPFDGDPRARLERLEGAIGPDHAPSIVPAEHVDATLRLIEHRNLCLCGATYEPRARYCSSCGRATFSQYAPARRAAAAPLEPETPQRAETG